ncbi:hypothetical protein L1887_31023 [Cichorium endivia]|nr:hypothetical protein L1887_31023 [Cichorium endivia]
MGAINSSIEGGSRLGGMTALKAPDDVDFFEVFSEFNKLQGQGTVICEGRSSFHDTLRQVEMMQRITLIKLER